MRGFLLDEHLPVKWVPQLFDRIHIEIKAVGIGGAPPKGATDPSLLDWCEREDFMLVTEDKKTIPQYFRHHLAVGKHIPGILILRPSAPVRLIFEALEVIAGASFQDEYRDQIRYVPMR